VPETISGEWSGTKKGTGVALTTSPARELLLDSAGDVTFGLCDRSSASSTINAHDCHRDLRDST
jgi:hypothetical protein